MLRGASSVATRARRRPAREVDDRDEALRVGGRKGKGARGGAARPCAAEQHRGGERGGMQELAAGHALSYAGATRSGPAARAPSCSISLLYAMGPDV